MKDDKVNPLLDQNIGREYEILNEETSTFNTSIDDINKDLDTKSVDDSTNITTLTNKLQNIKIHMERINEKIHYLRNFLKDGNQQNQLLVLSKIKVISDNISKKYEAVNRKFTEKISSAKRKIELEIEESERNEKLSIGGTDSSLGGGKVLQKLDSKVRIGIDRLKERKEDLEKIAKISYQLLELSRDMRRTAENQGRMVSSIEDNLLIANSKTNDANDQLNMRGGTQSSNVKLYFWICTILFVILAVAIFIIYWKYWRLSEVEEQKRNDGNLITFKNLI